MAQLQRPHLSRVVSSLAVLAIFCALSAASGRVQAVPLLLIPDSDSDRVMAFDPFSGALIDANFIAADPTHLSTPKHAIQGPGNTILVSDQTNDVVQRYSASGSYLGIFAPAGGANTAILDNIRGVATHPSTGNLLVTVGGGANIDAVAEFDGGGSFLGNFIASGAGGLDDPFDIAFHPGLNQFLVGGIASDAIHRFDISGNPVGIFATINTFPEQIAVLANGNVLVGNFSGSQESVLEFLSNGTLVNDYAPASLAGFRGVFELGNGNILTTNSGGVHEIDRLGNLVETELAGVNAQYIQLVDFDAVTVPEPASLALLSIALAGLGFLRCRKLH